MTGERDAVEFLLDEHRRFFTMFDEFDKVTDVGERRERFREIVQSLSGHEVVEELILWPTVQSELPDGDELARARQGEEDELSELLHALDKMDVADEGFDARARRFFEEVREHAGREEAEVFPQLREHVDAQLLRQLGAAMETAMRAAPTRPHPNVPPNALGNLAAGPAAAVMDRVRDAAESAMRQLRGG